MRGMCYRTEPSSGYIHYMTYTYIIESQGYYKIGKAIDIDKRMKSYDTHNPMYKLVKVYEGNHEKMLHKKYKNKHSHLEWFNLTISDIQELLVMELTTNNQIGILKNGSYGIITDDAISEKLRAKRKILRRNQLSIKRTGKTKKELLHELRGKPQPRAKIVKTTQQTGMKLQKKKEYPRE